ncbi:MAG: DUF1552 domain-containing protein [Bdellovibrionales bacterium]
MKPISRRELLWKFGQLGIALPFLSSLAPESVFGQSAKPKRRMILLMSNQGHFPKVFYPSAVPNLSGPGNTKYIPLSNIQGQLSPFFGTDFDKVRKKMSICRNLDLVAPAGHNRSFFTCASTFHLTDEPLTALCPPKFGISFDRIIEKSSVVYPSPTTIPALRITSWSGSQSSPSATIGHCWDRDASGKSIRLPFLSIDKNVFNYVFPGASPTTSSDFDKEKARKLLVGDEVFKSFQALKGLVSKGQITASEGQRVDNVLGLLSKLQQNVQSSQFQGCSKPSTTFITRGYSGLQTSEEALRHHYNYNDIVLAALACDLTRVVVIDIRHWAWHQHDDPESVSSQDKWLSVYRNHAKVVADLVAKMNSYTEADGTTLLDNSVVAWGNEMGIGRDHAAKDVPTVFFGGGQGLLNQGNYIDFDHRPINQVGVTVMRTMGLSSTDFMAYGDGKGFGQFNPDFSIYANYREIMHSLYDRYAADRNNPLPLLWRG